MAAVVAVAVAVALVVAVAAAVAMVVAAAVAAVAVAVAVAVVAVVAVACTAGHSHVPARCSRLQLGQGPRPSMAGGCSMPACSSCNGAACGRSVDAAGDGSVLAH